MVRSTDADDDSGLNFDGDEPGRGTLRIQWLTPHDASAPPCRPYGRWTRRSDRMDASTACRNSMSRITPSPPRCRPAPPEPRRSEKSRRMTGYRRSKTSASVIRVLVMCVCTPEVPSQSGPLGRGGGVRRIVYADVERRGVGASYRSATAGDGLVVPEPLAFFLARRISSKAKGQVVTVPLRRCACFERLEYDVRHALALETGGRVSLRRKRSTRKAVDYIPSGRCLRRRQPSRTVPGNIRPVSSP